MTSVPTPTAFLRRPGNVERIVVVLILFIYSFSLPMDWFLSRGDGVVQGGPITQLTFLTFFGVALLGLNGNWHIALAAAGREPLMPMLLGFALVTSLWSTLPGTTFSTVAVLCFTYVIAIYMAVRFSLEEVLYLAGIALALGILLNFTFIFVFPDAGVRVTAGDDVATWTGVFKSKNSLGRIATISALVFAMNARIRHSWIVWPSFAILAALQVLGSASATSLAAIVGIAALWFGFLGFRARKTLYGASLVMMITVFTTITVVAATNLAGVTALVGREATLTGRLPLWQDSIRYGISERFWSGHGWAAFWTGGGADFEVILRARFVAPHAHNAFIDAWLQGGPLPAIALALIYARGLFWAARNIRANPTAVGMFPALVISLGVIFSLTESGYVSRTSLFILFIIGLTHAGGNKGVQRPFRTPDNKTTELVLADSV
ncbi:MAG: exopolysaccharide production protein ExoQ [Verrucomicrobiales bacterium]|jgi:exopolysaccharide production protein ExoQ